VSVWKKIFGTPQASGIDNDSVVDIPVSDDLPITEQSDTPVTEQSDTPVTEQSDTPVTEQSDTPVTEQSEVNTSDSTSDQPEPSTSGDVEEVSNVQETEENVAAPVSPGNATNSQANSPLITTKLNSSVDESSDAKTEVDEAEQVIEDPEILAEEREYSEDLSILDGRILPELKVPNWREELEFVKERYEPCDLADHIVKVSKRRLTARRIDHELAQSRLTAYNRYLERASRRFKDKIDEDKLLKTALEDISQWRSDQAKSVAWVLADRVNEETLKARQAEMDATSFVANNVEFTNPDAIATYRRFARSLLIIPLFTAYVMSVVVLTYSRFDWIMKFLPFFNLGIAKVLFMIGGVSSYFLLRTLWRYGRAVSKVQRQLTVFNSKYQEQEDRIRHAVREHTRLSQQQPLVEPILRVLAKGYRVQLQSDISARAQVTTEFRAETLPACVSLARAVDTDEVKMARLKRRALKVLMSRGWRTDGLNNIARIHADSRMLDSQSLSLQSLETDSSVSATSAQKMLLEAFSNTSIHDRVSRERLVSAIKDLHSEVLANWESGDRPKVVSLRDFGFDKIAFRTSWLADEDPSEDWIAFLMEVLIEETAPFSDFNILNKRSPLNSRDQISSVAVVPHYFELKESKISVAHSPSKEVMPLDVVVRVDVSPWADPGDFTVFAARTVASDQGPEIEEEISTETPGGVTSA
jgi:hypothetical protein